MTSNTLPNNKKAVIYCRVSTKEQAEEGNSLVTQERNCREYALKHGFDIAHVFVEQGESAKTADRTELQKLFRFCADKKNGITAIIAYKIDRISRNTDDYSQIRILLKRYGVEIKSTSEYFENTPAGRFMENIIANVAQFDNDVRTERSVGGMVQAAREGRYVWNAPFGYSNQKVNGKSTIVPNEKAEAIRQTFEAIASRIYSVEEVRIHMAEKGLHNSAGRPFTKGHFYRLLHQKAYMGIIDKLGEQNPATYEPIISPELFTVVQNILERKKRSSPYLKENPDFPLRRFVTDASTGEKLSGAWSKGAKERYAYYRFVQTKHYFPKNAFETLFTNLLDSFAYSETFVMLLTDKMQKMLKDRSVTTLQKVEKIKQAIQTLKEKQQLLLQKNLNGFISDVVLKEAMSGIDQQIYELQQTQENPKKADVSTLLSYINEFLVNPSQLWEKLSFASKLKFQWFVFPKGIIFDGTELRTPEISFLFKLKEVFFDENSPNVPNTTFPSNRQNPQITLSCDTSDDSWFWVQLENDLILLNKIIHSDKMQDTDNASVANKLNMRKGG